MSFRIHRGNWPRLVTCDHRPAHTHAVTPRDAEQFAREHTAWDCLHTQAFHLTSQTQETR